MVIQCQNCKTMFRLRDDQLSRKTVKVRCSKCKEVFTVNPEELQAAAKTVPTAAPKTPPAAPPPKPKKPAAPTSPSTGGKKTSTYSLEDLTLESESDFLPNFNQVKLDWETPEPLIPPTPQDLEKTQIMPSSSPTPKPMNIPVPPPPEKKVKKQLLEEGEEFDIHKFFDLNRIKSDAEAAAPEAEGTSAPETEPPAAEAPPTEEFISKPPPLSATKSAVDKTFMERAPIATRKPDNRGLKIPPQVMIGGIALFGLLVVLLALTFFGIIHLPFFGSKHAPVAFTSPLKDLKAFYTKNNQEGMLFIIEGTLTNLEGRPLSFAKVQGKIYNQEGKVIKTAESFCGNVLNKKKLAIASRQDLEINQKSKFGTQYSNVNLPPKGTIPFQIIFFQPPSEMADYGVEFNPPPEK